MTEFTSPYSLNTQRGWHTSDGTPQMAHLRWHTSECTSNLTMGRILETTVVVEKQLLLRIVSVCL